MKLNIPTMLTLFRIILIPVLIVIFYLPVPGARTAAAVIFMLAALSDWLDGYLARKLAMTSPFGAFLDPVADKLMITTALIMLLQQDPSFLLMLSTVVIVGREIAISALREWMAEIGERGSVAVSWIGKVKTVAQMTAVTLLLYEAPVGPISTYSIGLLILFIAAILTLWSMMRYLIAAWPTLKGRTDN